MSSHDKSGCAALVVVFCTLAVCATLIIVSGYGPAFWGGILAVLSWLLTAWLWCLGFLLAVVVFIALLALFGPR